MIRYLQKKRDKLIDHLSGWLSLAEMRRLKHEQEKLLSQLKACGRNVSIDMPIRYSGAANWEMGDNCHLGQNAFVRADGGLTIGANTSISRNLLLYTVNHNWTADWLPYGEGSLKKRVIIGQNVWIGMNVVICPGSVINDGAIVGMGTVVSGEVPARAIIAGQKWRIIGERDEETYERIVASGQFSDHRGAPWHPGDNNG